MNVKLVAAWMLALGTAGGVLALRAEPGGAAAEPPGDAPGAAADRQPAPATATGVPQLRSGDVPLGSLGQPLGAALTVAGTRSDRLKAGSQTLQVDTVNGHKLDKPVDVWVENIRTLPAGTPIVLKGYETGKMDGPVPAAIEAAEAKGETVLLPQRGWQWCPYFVALAAVRPQLPIQEIPTGFKTLKQKTQEEKNP